MLIFLTKLYFRTTECSNIDINDLESLGFHIKLHCSLFDFDKADSPQLSSDTVEYLSLDCLQADFNTLECSQDDSVHCVCPKHDSATVKYCCEDVDELCFCKVEL